MPTLRTKVNKRKSDSFVIDHDKAIKKLATEKKLAAEKKIANEKKFASVRKVTNETKKNTNASLSAQFKSLQEAFNALTVENDENKKRVDLLKKQVSELQKSRSFTRECKESQKEMKMSSIEEFKCQKCEFQGSSNHILKMHLNTEHRLVKYSCYQCDTHCETHGDLMAHRKEKHFSATGVCSFFMEGKCAFNKDVCWFKHEKLETTEDSSVPQKLKEYNCGFCGKIFENKKDFMIHRKTEHVNSVSECFKNKNKCRFGEKNCWFRHEKESSYSKIENSESKNSGIKTSEMLKRLFAIMEAFGERMCIVENQI